MVTAKYTKGFPMEAIEGPFSLAEDVDRLPTSFVHEFEIVCSGSAAAMDLALWLAVENPDATRTNHTDEEIIGTLRPTDPPRKVTFKETDFPGGKVPRGGFLVGRWTDGTGAREERLLKVELHL
ncbi:MAG: hypothetical protein ABSC36_00365 [Gaiellaceae bacterium]|jgi:hypothetical protein